MESNSTLKKRYAIVGLGGRCNLFSEALLKTYSATSELVALCDTNQTRMDYHNRQFLEKYQAGPFPTYKAEDFDRMVVRGSKLGTNALANDL